MKQRKNVFNLQYFFIILFFCFVLFIIGINLYRVFTVAFGKPETITATVTEKGIKRISGDKGGRDVYLVYTQTDAGEINVFQVTDSLLAGRFDSSDVYAGIMTGKKYEFAYRGSRNRLLSWYPNIYKYTLINQ